jgi:uncharacterized protein
MKFNPEITDRPGLSTSAKMPLSTAMGAGESCSSGGCSSGCGSASDRHMNGSGEAASSSGSAAREIYTDVPFAQRRLNLGATPEIGTFVTAIDLDLTVACNLRCIYCFKEKWNEHMEEQVAFDTLVWLLYASGPANEVHVNFMGGEPLIRFKLIQKIVPFGKRRARQIGKTMRFGVTTNGTLVTDAVVAFWKKWGMGFHTSIDGDAEIQDQNRPMVSGHGSSRLVEKSVPKILSYRPNTTARSTVVPASVGSLVRSYHYFRSLGYTNIAFVPGGPSLWTEEANTIYEQEFSKLGDLVIEEFRNGRFINLKGVDDAVRGIVRNQRPKHACGAGRGLLLIDIHGDIWPCHRWNKGSHRSWQIGNIYEHFDQMARAELDQSCQTDLLEQDCETCVANKFCGGGCPAENLEETGKVYKRHLNACEHTRVWARVGQRVHDVLFQERNTTFMKHYYNEEEAVQALTHHAL